MFIVFIHGENYRNNPKFLDRYAWANRADPEQSDQGLHCLPFRLHSAWTHYSVVEPHISNFRVIQQIFWVSEYLGNLRYFDSIMIYRKE